VVSIPSAGVTVDVTAAGSGIVLGEYAVTISGAAGGNGFQRPGALYLLNTVTTVTTNDFNAVDVCLLSGFPGGQPDVGAIW
jgi:hypothetical protein